MREPARTSAINVGGTVNVLEAARAAGERAPGEVINVGSGKSSSLIDLIGTLKQVIGGEAHRLAIEHQAPRAGDLRASSADISKARKLLGYEPQVTLAEGLAGVVEFFRTTPARAA